MNRLITLGVAAAMLMTAACAQNRVTRDPTQSDLDRMAAEYNAKVEDPEDQVVCTRETEVGSRFKEVKCRTKRQLEWEEQEARRYATKPRPTVTK